MCCSGHVLWVLSAHSARYADSTPKQPMRRTSEGEVHDGAVLFRFTWTLLAASCLCEGAACCAATAVRADCAASLRAYAKAACASQLNCCPELFESTWRCETELLETTRTCQVVESSVVMQHALPRGQTMAESARTLRVGAHRCVPVHVIKVPQH